MGRRRRPLTAAALAALLAAAPAAAGTLSGQVVFRGAPPALPAVAVTKDREACGEALPAEALVVGPAGGVRHAVAFLEGVPAPAAGPPAEATLENRRCRFVPHVLALRTGAELAVVNADPVLHNLRGWLEQRGVFNIVQSTQGQVSRRTIKRAGVIRLSCDAHPHMHGWLLAFEHPYFAVTDAGGRFTLRDVPAGAHRLAVWHQGWRVVRRDEHGRLTYDAPRVVAQDVTVPAAGAVRVAVELGE
ncbi:MAG TPA: carboxypeptidase regulatory-like domain-containing protein [Methylomirabilota bacterium]|nr:carboxypeptidase regulatory-like domain-containing protein [Methylomirabilota bacterium]